MCLSKSIHQSEYSCLVHKWVAPVPVLGIVENMSYLESDRGQRIPVFGMGGGEQIAQELSAPLLGQIPLDPRICSGGDTANPITLQADSLATQIFEQIATALSQTLAISLEMRQNEKSSAK